MCSTLIVYCFKENKNQIELKLKQQKKYIENSQNDLLNNKICNNNNDYQD